MANEISSALEGFALIGHEETAWGTLSGKMIELPTDTDRWRIVHDLTKIYAKAGVGDRWAANLVTVGRKLGSLTLPGAFLADISGLLWWATIGTDTVAVQQSPVEWLSEVSIGLGDIGKPTSLLDHIYECTTAGTTGVTEPDPWGVVLGETTVDGTVTWTCRAPLWKHALTYLTAGGLPTLPEPLSAQIYEGDKAADDKMKQFLGAVVRSATLEWDASADDGILDNSFELVSKAPTLELETAGYTDPLFKPLPSWAIAITMCESGGSPSEYKDVVRCGFNWENNAEMVKTAIGANAPSDRAYGEATVSGRMVLLFRNYTEYSRWEAGTQTAWVITATDPVAITGSMAQYRKIVVTMPYVDYQVLEVQKLGAFKVVNVTYKAQRCPTLKAAAIVDIYNAVKDYAA